MTQKQYEILSKGLQEMQEHLIRAIDVWKDKMVAEIELNDPKYDNQRNK